MPPRNETVRDRSNCAAAKKLRSSSPYPLPRLRHIVPVPVRERNRCPLPRRCFTFVETALPAQALWKCLRDFRIHYIAKEKDHETVKKVQRPCHARRPRKTQGKCVLFADAAKLYIEYSKAVTSAETHLPLRPARDRVRLRAARTRYVQNNTLLLDTMHTKCYHTLTS